MNDHKSFWATLPGILTGLAAVITAVGGLIITLNAVGGDEPSADPQQDLLQAHNRHWLLLEVG